MQLSQQVPVHQQGNVSTKSSLRLLITHICKSKTSAAGKKPVFEGSCITPQLKQMWFPTLQMRTHIILLKH